MISRDAKIDGLKFLMIYCVVLAHIRYNDYGLELNKMIYAFHMPVFIFLSGYLTSLKATMEKRLSWCKHTLIIYVFAQIFHLLLALASGYVLMVMKKEPFDSLSLIRTYLVVPGFTLWYLLCLIYWRLAVWYLSRWVSDRWLFAGSLVLAFAAGFVPVDEVFSFQRAFSFFPFFVLGWIFRKKSMLQPLERIHAGYAVVALVVGLAAARFLPAYMPKFHYAGLDSLWLRMVQTALAVGLCMAIIRVSRASWVARFAPLGKYTLWIYIGHSFLIIIAGKIISFFGLTFNIVVALLLTACFCALCVGAARLWHHFSQERPSADSVPKS